MNRRQTLGSSPRVMRFVNERLNDGGILRRALDQGQRRLVAIGGDAKRQPPATRFGVSLCLTHTRVPLLSHSRSVVNLRASATRASSVGLETTSANAARSPPARASGNLSGSSHGADDRRMGNRNASSHATATRSTVKRRNRQFCSEADAQMLTEPPRADGYFNTCACGNSFLSPSARGVDAKQRRALEGGNRRETRSSR